MAKLEHNYVVPHKFYGTAAQDGTILSLETSQETLAELFESNKGLILRVKKHKKST